MLSWLSRLCASLLVPLLFVAVVAFTLSQTLLSSHYIQGKLVQVNAYPKLSSAIITQVTKDTSDSPLPPATIATELQTIVTPQVLQQTFSNTLDQIQTYYKHGGAVPTVDVSPLINQAVAAGLPVPKDTDLTAPVQLTAVANAKKASDQLAGVRIGTIVAIAVLAASMIAIAIRRGNYKPLANVLTSLGIFVGVVGTILFFVSGAIDSHLKLDSTNAFTQVGHDLALSIVRDFAKRLIIAGVITLVVGVAARLLIGRFTKPAAPVSRAKLLPSRA